MGPGAGWPKGCWQGLLPEVEGLGQGGLETSAGRPGGRGPAPELPPFLASHCPRGSFPGKIEIKIVRPGAEGTEEDARWLTDEDTRNLKEIFFNILVRGCLHPAPDLQALALLWRTGESRARLGAHWPVPASPPPSDPL